MKELYRETLVSLPEPLMVIERGEKILFYNEALRLLLGLPDSCYDVELQSICPDICASSCRMTGALTTHIHSMKGESFPAKVAITPLKGEYTLIRVIALAENGDDAAAYHSQRLETLGLLAGGFAHDFNNLLTGMLGHITYLRTILPATGDHVESLQAIQEGGRRAAYMTREMLMFAKFEEEDAATPCDISDMVHRTCTLLRGAVSPLYRLQYRVPQDPIYVYAVPSRISQVIANLIINARDALSNSGSIEVGLELVTNNETIERFFGADEVFQKKYVRLYVVDDGHGMSEKLQDKIFDPFFSTKKGKGTGLGLTTVAAIVKGCGGEVEIFSREAVGTSVSVYFPVVDKPASSHEADRHFDESPLEEGAAGETIFVVDDEHLVRNVLSVSLQHLGYTVEVACSGKEAIEIFSERGGIFDLVILDMVMPEMSGEDVFERLREFNPEVRVIMVSGMCSQQSIDRITSRGGRFIRKPFTIHDLSKVVRETLNQTQSAA